MYIDFYGLINEPFRTTADGENFFLSPSHREALGSILYGIKQRKGVIVVTGEVGVGKTTILRRCLQIAAPMQGNSLQEQKTVHLYNPNVDFNRLLITILRQLDAEPCSDETAEMLSQVHELARSEQSHGGTIVLMIDEAQSLPFETLEGIRMLTNLEAANEKLIQIVLIGQPELETLLERYELRHVRERVAVRATILPLTRSESLEYIQFRLNQASREQVSIFSAGALAVIVKAAHGIPRRLNILCDNALVAGFRRRQPIVSRKTAKQVLIEETDARSSANWRRREAVMVAVSLAIALPILGYIGSHSNVFSELPQLFHENATGHRDTPEASNVPVRSPVAHAGALVVSDAAVSPQPVGPAGPSKADAGSSESGAGRTEKSTEGLSQRPPNPIQTDTRMTASDPGRVAKRKDPGIDLIDLGGSGLQQTAGPLAALAQAALSSEADRSEAARLLAVLLDSGRVVLGKAQSTINNPRLEDKNFSSSVFVGRLRKEFLGRTGHDLQSLRNSPMPEAAKPLLLNLSSVMQKAVQEVQPEINKKGIGFKGFIPATFGTKVAEIFSKETGMSIRQIGPPDTEPRNPNNKPDDEEERALLAIQRSHPRAGDHVVEQKVPDRGVRVLLPLFYNRSCLGCHGKPKGEIDISGYQKEGFKEGDLGGAISVLFPETVRPSEQARAE
jgi:general secretion pathway protein A